MILLQLSSNVPKGKQTSLNNIRLVIKLNAPLFFESNWIDLKPLMKNSSD
jgi:hypothetical protein